MIKDFIWAQGMGSIRNRQSQGPFKTSGTEMWPAKMCQWISSMLLSSWASSATTASKGVPDTQSGEENETPQELADTFLTCQLEDSRVLGGFGPPRVCACQEVRETSTTEGTLLAREVASR